jgi:hypothetical protein
MPESKTDAEKADGLRGALGTILRSLGIGTAGGGLASIVAAVADPRGPAVTAGALAGVAIGFVNGLSEVWIKHIKGQHEADAEPNYQARIAAERDLATCRAEKEGLRSKIESMEQHIRKLDLDVAMYHAHNQKLTSEVVDLARRLTNLDGRRDHEPPPR